MPKSAERSRDDYLPEVLASVAFHLAQAHGPSNLTRRGRRRTVLPTDLTARFDQMFEALADLDQAAVDKASDVELLLENDYVVREALALVRDHTPRDGYRPLPLLATAPQRGQLRMLMVADELLNVCGAPLDLGWVRDFLLRYQQDAELSLGELWALPNLLRILLLQRLINAVQGTLAGAGQAGAGSQSGQPIGSLVLGLRALSTEDWVPFVESVSLVHGILCRDPTRCYDAMDRATRNDYRNHVERIARATGRTETEVARHALALAEDHAGGEPEAHRPWDAGRREAHVGTYLVDVGGQRLVATLNQGRARIEGLKAALSSPMTWWYLLAIAAVAGLLLGSFARHVWGAAGLPVELVGSTVALILALTAAVHLVNWLVSLTRRPRLLPKMDFRSGVPPSCATVVTMPALLSSPEEVEHLLLRLETNYLGNRDPMIRYALLTDPVDADAATLPEDQQLLDLAARGVEELNARYADPSGPPFFLFHRPRQWNPREGCYMAWERKRGKLAEFNQLLLGSRDPRGHVRVGDPTHLENTRFVITLDADTQLLTGTAQSLISTLAHPLCQPVTDPLTGRVEAGYSIIQPRIAVEPEVAGRNPFTRAFAGDVVLDLYSHAVSDVYQDLFGVGIYAGKGIYDVRAFEASLKDRVPANAILSHDLFEGLHGRVGLATDIVLLEGYPDNLIAYARRAHRWVRGDWQLLPWLLPRVRDAGGRRVRNRFATIDRWKLADNVRRSLLPPAALLGFVLSWVALPGAAWVWSLATVLVTLSPIGLSSMHALGTGIAQGGTWRSIRERLQAAAQSNVMRGLYLLAFLPYEAWVNVDAASRACWRTWVSGRRRLQWVSAEESTRRVHTRLSLRFFYGEMAIAPATSLVVAGAVAIVAPTALFSAWPLLLAWLLAPLLAYASTKSKRRPPERIPLDAGERQFARNVALRTWLFFERFIGPENHWLPPDNYHEAPKVFLSRRTSPTNIGLMLLATLGAYDMGYQGISTVLPRLRHSFESLRRLERYRGHFLNWYRLDDLSALEPRYVSTVDSGNLAASLLALRGALTEMLDAPLSPAKLRRGLEDMLLDLSDLMASVISDDAREASQTLLNDLIERVRASASNGAWIELMRQIEETELRALMAAVLDAVRAGIRPVEVEKVGELRRALNLVRHQVQTCRHESRLVPWQAWPDNLPAGPANTEYVEMLRALEPGPSIRALPELCAVAERRLARVCERLRDGDALDRSERSIAAHVDRMRGQMEAAANTATQLAALADDLSREAGELFSAMDFGFLYDRDRRLLRIGYSVTNGENDANHYDLLASEARLGSYVAIAKGDVPLEHWLHLGRPFTRIGSRRVLVSWSATAFEYLMPHLLMRAPPQTLIGESCEVAIEQQQRFAGEHGLPWGISESGFYQLDKDAHYQYRAFGVPNLGLRLDSSYRMVIAPYASALALPFSPGAAVANLRRLVELGAFGRLGFFEAVDFGIEPAHREVSRRGRVVRSYMTHHQGMILIALVNAMTQGMFVRRFHADPLIASCSHLLYEQIQPGTAAPIGWREKAHERRVVHTLEELGSWRVDTSPEAAQVNVLGNEHYQVQINHAGVSASFWKGLCLTRWRNDPCDMQGACIYVQDLDSQALWSAGCRPMAPRDPADCSTYFAPHAAEFHRRDHGINLTMAVTVCGQHDVEVRRIALVNDTERPRRLLLLSYSEPVLAPLAEHERHPAFNKLFVEVTAMPAEGIVMARRRLRDSSESPLYFAQAVSAFGETAQRRVFYVDRSDFLGRAGSQGNPAALARQPEDAARANGEGVGVDPILAIGIEFELAPRATAEVAFLSAAGRSRADVVRALFEYQSAPKIGWAFHQARAHTQRLLSDLAMPARDVRRSLALYSAVLARPRRLRTSPGLSAESGELQSLLWSRSISGDLPILLLQVRGSEDVNLAEELVRMHLYWDRQQVAVDLILLDSEIGGYMQPARTRLSRMVEVSRERWRHHTQGSVYIIPAAELGDRDRNRLLAAAWLVLDPSRGAMKAQLAPLPRPLPELPMFVPMPSSPLVHELTPTLTPPEDLRFANGFGGFTADGTGYSIFLEPGQTTPAPWCNVIANPRFGFLISERGAMCTWSDNSSEHRLSPWHNDPVCDPSGESLFLRDEETGMLWSPLPQPLPADAAYRVTHGVGYSVAEHVGQGLQQELRLFVDTEDPVKLVRLRLTNLWRRPRRLTATYYMEWVLGSLRGLTAPYIVSALDRPRSALYARNQFVGDCQRTAFLAASEMIHAFTTDRREFLGLDGDPRRPAGLLRIGLSDEVRNGGDPCAALQVHVDIGPMQTVEVCFVVGEGDTRQEAERLAERYRQPSECEAAWQRVQAEWDAALGGLQVETPDADVDLMVNRWLLYQTMACRMRARAALYQAGGGFGFRDQLQDVMALTASQPASTRAQILRAAAVQFTEGDVLHWWHEAPLRGVRTRCSDDLLWLVYVTAHYVRTTGESAILDERVAYLEAPELSSDERERYAEYRHTRETESLYDHCRRAVQRSSATGAHGLPLIGSGDWNDGFNGIGREGRGESVWLGWFLAVVYRDFAYLADQTGEAAVGHSYRERAERLATHVDRVAWDGDWYVRAYDDDGTPVGAADNDECRIDLNAQTWAVLAAAPNRGHAARAMASAAQNLAGDGILRLLTPPFQHGDSEPGYIAGYPPGVRENGAQYSHAAVWAGWAYGAMGDGDRALEVFRCVSPVRHAAEDPARYAVEPYVVAADIYGTPPLTGRGGWTWYTGAAGWAYRLAVEVILGLRRRGAVLEIEPCLPAAWPGFQARWRIDGSTYEIRAERAGPEQLGVYLDGQRLDTRHVPLDRSGACHEVVVRIGPLLTETPTPEIAST